MLSSQYLTGLNNWCSSTLPSVSIPSVSMPSLPSISSINVNDLRVPDSVKKRYVQFCAQASNAGLTSLRLPTSVAKSYNQLSRSLNLRGYLSSRSLALPSVRLPSSVSNSVSRGIQEMGRYQESCKLFIRGYLTTAGDAEEKGKEAQDTHHVHKAAPTFTFDPLRRTRSSSGSCSDSSSSPPYSRAASPCAPYPTPSTSNSCYGLTYRTRRAGLGQGRALRRSRRDVTVKALPGVVEGAVAEAAMNLSANVTQTWASIAVGLSSGVVAKATATCLGYGVLLGSCLRSVPQILRIWKKQSVEGISLTSNMVEMVAYTVICGYNTYRAYPFSTFGDTAMCLLQDVILLGLFVKFGKLSLQTSLLAVAGMATIGWWVASGSCGNHVLNALQASSMLLLSLGSRLPQIILNWRRGNTGELSMTTSLLNFTGNIARLFTTAVLTQDSLIMAGTSLQTVLNGVLVGQIFKSNKASSNGEGKGGVEDGGQRRKSLGGEPNEPLILTQPGSRGSTNQPAFGA